MAVLLDRYLDEQVEDKTCSTLMELKDMLKCQFGLLITEIAISVRQRSSITYQPSKGQRLLT